ncbi:hypothetical protein [Acinetobacter sp. YH12233]|uniref:hypothetical protein n=1 Tax=Acinetobacter sp. YH12233 TaxID=2601161 RepID=UPI0015D292DA|nr:hypothetical protein [Acinetobacter sp. YH12233]
MDIEKLKAEFEQSECFKRLEHVAQYTFFEFGAYIKRTNVPADIEKKCGKLITALLFSWSAWKEAKAQAVPDLSELQERIAGHQYYHDEHGHMIVDMDDVVKEISGFDSWKAQSVPEGFVLVPKENISCFWQDDDEPENFCNSSNDWDCLGDGIEKDQIMIVNKHTQAHISTEKFFGVWKLIETSYGTRWKFELFKSEFEAKQAMIEAQESAND